MLNRTYILGGYQTDFAINYTKQNKDIYDLLEEGVTGALTQTKIDPKDIERFHIGNFVGELFCNQGQLGGLMGHIHPAFEGVPASRHEAACASGSMAILGAMAEIEAQRYDVIAVVGVELMRNVPGKQAAEYLGTAAWTSREGQDAEYPWPHFFDKIAQYYKGRYGLDKAHLAEIAKINYANAKNNPKSQTRNWETDDAYFGSDVQLNPTIEGMLQKSDCGRITDGCSTVILVSEEYAKKYVDTHGMKISELPYISGWGHTTAPMLLETKLEAAKESTLAFPWVAKAIQDARYRAGIKSISEISAIETHDCFTISEYVAIDHLGLTAPGESWKAIEEGRITMQGDMPINPSGGLLANGHPVGATGIRMVLDGYKQCTGQAGNYQVENAQNIATLNIGGSLTTIASFIVTNNVL